MAEGHTEREPIPRGIGSREEWPRYAAGMLTETAYVLVLSVVALVLAIVAMAVFR